MNRVAALCVALMLFAGVGNAAAHATLLSTSPEDGSTLTSSPAEIVLRFDEPVAPLLLRMVDGSHAAVTLTARSEGATLRVPVPSTGREGAFVFSYRVVSADSHPVAGSIVFVVGRAAAALPPPAAENLAPAVGVGWSVVRTLRDAFLLVAAGGALFSLGMGAFPAQRLVLCVCGIGAALTTLLGVGMQAAVLMERPFSLSAMALPPVWQTPLGVSALFAIAACMTIVVGAFVQRGWLRSVLLGAGAFAAPACLALSGHAASAHPRWLSAISVAAHATAAAFWAGALVALWLLLRRGGPGAVPALRRFSAVAVGAVVVLVGCGTAFAALHIGSAHDLVATRYGNLLLAKAGLLALLLVIAACNRYVLVPRLERAAPASEVLLQRSIALEIVLVAAVVAVTAVLSRTPPREGAAVMAEMAAGSAVRARLTVTPGRPGRNVIVVNLFDGLGRPLDPAAATLRLEHPGAGIEAIQRDLARLEPGSYRYEGNELTLPGRWRIGVRARIGDFDVIEMGATIGLK